MAAMRGPRLAVGSAAWVAEERASALKVAQAEVEEFSFSARNDFDWLNEHMAGIFDENEVNVAEIFKTPGKLRGKTPRTARKANPAEARIPLSDVFSSTPNGPTNSFSQQLNKLQSPKPATPGKSPLARKPVGSGTPRAGLNASPGKPVHPADSGYHGSQSEESTQQASQPAVYQGETRTNPREHVAFHVTKVPVNLESPPMRTAPSPEDTFQTAKEEQTTRVLPDLSQKMAVSPARQAVGITQQLKAYPVNQSSPKRSSPLRPSPDKAAVDDAPSHESPLKNVETVASKDEDEDSQDDASRSPSDGSSPIRPVVRKSSLTFASLPAREPLTSNKSLGPRVSRTSQLDQHRTSYYNRHTGGKSLGGNANLADDDQEDHDEMDIDTVTQTNPASDVDDFAVNHHKTYTQRLQDQISMLGKSKPSERPSKSIPNLGAVQQPVAQPQKQETEPKTSPVRTSPVRTSPVKTSPIRASPRRPETTTPGAFPVDDDDDWIAPPSMAERGSPIGSPRPGLPKSYSADVMEGIHSKDTVGGEDFILPKQRLQGSRPASPKRAPAVPERTTSVISHHKSASVSALPDMGFQRELEMSPKKGISVSNPTLSTVSEVERPETPPKSPSRSFRDSPLKQVKSKLSSILKSSKGLLASSAAISAEGKTSAMSPSRLDLHNPSTESLAAPSIVESMYPDLRSRNATAPQSPARTGSPARANTRRTRASAEREKEEKKKEKEAKRLAEQMDKLERAREKEREKARVFSQEQEKVASMERLMTAKEPVKEPAKPAASPRKEAPRPTRTSPRKAKAQPDSAPQDSTDKLGDQDVEMADAPAVMGPPSLPRSATASTATTQASRPREVKRPVKPGRDASAKSKQAPTVIRVNTGSQSSQFHPSNSVISANLHETLGQGNQSQPHLNRQTSRPNLQKKASTQSLKSSTSATGRPKALEMAARRKEQEEREAQRRREAKLEIERKRAALQEEERRQEQQRRQEAERQKEREREEAEAKKRAAIERAKQTRAPPPAVRAHAQGPPDYAAQRGDVPRPQSRMGSSVFGSQQEQSRPVNAVLSMGQKGAVKRQVPHDDDGHARNGQTRTTGTYQGKDAKRRRTSDDFGEDDGAESQRNIKGPPVRPSGGLKKELPQKAIFANGYAPAPASNPRDLFKATVTGQHANQAKAAHPLDMAQVSKGAIPFGQASHNAGASHKTPARPGPPGAAKSAARSAPRSSPRFPNGDSIELPEIQTDDEDDEDDERPNNGTAPWADSPNLRKALMQQEPLDPSQIFGPPAPLVMEEVFSKSRERWHKFRARTSSANWSGSDRLTEEEIRKDLMARDKMRRDGGWSYEMSKDLL